MDFDFTPEQQRFRAEARAWLTENVPADLKGRALAASRADRQEVDRLREWQRTLHKAGYVGLDWPAEYGGRGTSLMEQIILYEEMSRAEAPQPINRGGISMLGPTLMAHGTAAQKARHLGKILNAEEIWCQGFSEPNAGSDLANLQTRAVLDGDWYVIDGQKVWTSMAHVSEWGFFLVRTDPNAAKHKGITFILVDMKTPGIRIRPLRQITGEAEFNEVFLENVRVPASNVVGKVNEGWGVAITTLAHERDVLTMIRHISLRTALERLVTLARRTRKNGGTAAQDPVLRQKIAGLCIGERCLQLNGYRSLTRVLQGRRPGPEGFRAKLFWSQIDQELAQLATKILGPASQLVPGAPGAPDGGR
ncbi:MAG: acyl-CoA dehydrogenase family protein, partial [Candidatus Rokubacteria bacterium]|nr:acyl-CoA dehydrogenase family protein [Candidatus Rokubacteria bacterium]